MLDTEKKYLFAPFKTVASYTLLVFVCLILFFANLRQGDLSGESDGNYAEIPREMLETGEWVIPQLNYVPYMEKPPLFYWLTALTYRVLGVNTFTARFWSALPAMLLVLTVFAFVRYWRSTRDAMLSALILATSAGMIAMSRISYMDMLLCLLTAWGLFAFYLGDATGKRGWFLLFFAGVAGAVLTKGLIGVVLPCLAIFFYVVVLRRWRTLGNIPWLLGIVLFLAITVPWHLFACVKNDRFFWFYFVNEHWLRFLGRRWPQDYFKGPVTYHFLRVLLLFLPWSLFLLFLAANRIKELLRDRLNVFLVCWFAAFLLFYTVSRAKANYYMMPALPALAMFLGLGIPRVWSWVKGRLWITGIGLLAIASTIFYVVLVVYPYSILKNVAPGSYPLLLAASFVLTSCLAGSLIGALRARWLVSFGFLVAGIVIGSIPLLSRGLMLDARGSVKPLTRFILANEGPDTTVVLRGVFEENSQLAFYRQKRFVILSDQGDVGGDLDFGARFPQSKPYFVQWREFLQNFRRDEKILYITLREEDYGELFGNHPTKCRLICRIADRLLIANFPPKHVRPE